MVTLNQIVVSILVLAIVSVLAGNKQTPAFITAAGNFLVAMVKKVEAA